jgi:hypothetical protein
MPYPGYATTSNSYIFAVLKESETVTVKGLFKSEREKRKEDRYF